jgi:hypothetical protein
MAQTNGLDSETFLRLSRTPIRRNIALGGTFQSNPPDDF